MTKADHVALRPLGFFFSFFPERMQTCLEMRGKTELECCKLTMGLSGGAQNTRMPTGRQAEKIKLGKCWSRNQESIRN